MNPIFISGVARSGTTLLGRLVGTLSNIEYEFEPLYLLQLPVLWLEGELRWEIAVGLLANAMHETMIELVLGRKVNLRPTDWSRFWLMKSYEDLTQRWNQSDARQDVLAIIAKRGLRLACKYHSLMPFYFGLLEAFPEGQIINITRNCSDVVSSVLKKGWMSNEGLRQHRGIVPKREVPWWVPWNMEEKFLSWNEATRALYMWRYLVRAGVHQVPSDRVLDIKYEDLVGSPRETLFKIQDFLGTPNCTPKTEETLLSIDPSRARKAELDKSLFDPLMLLHADRLMQQLGY